MGAASQTPIFKIQILTGRTRIKTTDRQFKGLADVDCYEEGGLFKYTVGASADYNAIARQRREILDKFPEAFIIAFKNGQKMNVNEAIIEFKKNKGKEKIHEKRNQNSTRRHRRHRRPVLRHEFPQRHLAVL